MRIAREIILSLSVAALVAVVFAPKEVRADKVADFYKGNTLTVTVGYGPSGGYALYARQLVQYWPKYIPGNPSVIIKFMPGGGGLRAGNYMYNWNFASAFTMALAILATLAYVVALMLSHDWHFQSISTEFVSEKSQLGHVLIGILMVYQAVMILTAIAVACSTRLGWVLTLLICIGVSFLGLVAESLLGEFVHNPDMGAYTQPVGYILWGLAKIVYVILPNFQLLWPADSLLNQIWKDTPNADLAEHFLTISAYGLLQISAFLLLAIGLFQTRELG